MKKVKCFVLLILMLMLGLCLSGCGKLLKLGLGIDNKMYESLEEREEDVQEKNEEEETTEEETAKEQEEEEIKTGVTDGENEVEEQVEEAASQEQTEEMEEVVKEEDEHVMDGLLDITVDGFEITLLKTPIEDTVKYFMGLEQWEGEAESNYFDHKSTKDLLVLYGADGFITQVKYGFTTYDDESADTIYQVPLELPKGITQLSTAADVVAAYGEPNDKKVYEDMNMMWYGYHSGGKLRQIRIAFNGTDEDTAGLYTVHFVDCSFYEGQTYANMVEDYNSFFE